jgi:hypothetical protein
LQNGPGENPRQEAERGAKEAVEEVSPWVARLARFGYVTKGVMYIVVGLLVVEMATGTGGRTTSLRGALQVIGAQPLGWVMLGLTALGLAGYALCVQQPCSNPGQCPENLGKLSEREYGYLQEF